MRSLGLVGVLVAGVVGGRWYLSSSRLQSLLEQGLSYAETKSNLKPEWKGALERAAHTLQSAFLPKQLPRRPGLRFDAFYLAAGSEALVGGDWRTSGFDYADENLHRSQPIHGHSSKECMLSLEAASAIREELTI